MSDRTKTAPMTPDERDRMADMCAPTGRLKAHREALLWLAVETATTANRAALNHADGRCNDDCPVCDKYRRG